jgi:hypothetical protein
MTCVNFLERTRKEHPDARAARRLDLDLVGDCANDAQTEAAPRQRRTLDKGTSIRDLYAQFSPLETGEQLDVSVAAPRVVCVRVFGSVGQGLTGRRRDIVESGTIK